MCALAAIGLVGTAISAAGAIAQGQQAKVMADYQAKAYQQQAAADAMASGYEQQRERQKQALLMSNAKAQVGASGVALAGSPTEVLIGNARQGELDIQAIQYGSQLRQNSLNTQAAISSFQGAQAQKAGYINAASTAASGLGNAYVNYKTVQMGLPNQAFR
jgi:hypothetical protein